MNDELKLRQIVEGLILASSKPMSLEHILAVFSDQEKPDRDVLKKVLEEISGSCKDRGFELKKVASGYRFQVREEISDWVGRLWDERPQKYSRALLETLSIIAYRQPITRGDIEKVRGVAVSSGIVRTLLDREWVRVVGHRDVPGRPAMYATTRQFLDYFNLENLEQLPVLAEIRELAEEVNQELNLEEEKPEGNVIELPTGEDNEEELVASDEEEMAAAIGTRSMNEILGIEPEPDDETGEDTGTEQEELDPGSEHQDTEVDTDAESANTSQHASNTDEQDEKAES